MTPDKRSRIRGSLLGLACGDALGAPFEFSPAGSPGRVSDFVGGGPFNLKPGEWTDDTSLALCLAESLVECRGFDPRDQLERYLRWYKEGHLSATGNCFDIGLTTARALHDFARTGRLKATASESSSGNGSLMRLAPVPLAYHNTPAKAVALSGKSSVTTHASRECKDACRYFGGLITGALLGASKQDLLAARYSPVPGLWQSEPLAPKIDQVAAGSFKQKQPPDIRGTGYVVHSLEAALWAFDNSDDFETGCTLAVSLGEDTDTTAAVYGQLAGAYYGEDAIPARWRKGLARAELITSLADRLFELSTTNPR